MKIKTEIKKQTVITEKKVKSFILNEREALFLRDLLGGAVESAAFRYIQAGHNFGKWTREESDETYMGIFNTLDNELRKSC